MILALSLPPPIAASLFQVWLAGGELGVALAATLTVVLVGGIALTQRRASLTRREAIQRGVGFEGPAILRLEQLLSSPQLAVSVKDLKERLRRRGWGQLGGKLTVGNDGLRWRPDAPARRRGVSELRIPWCDIDGLEIVPMAGIGGGVGLELHLVHNAQLSVHTVDADALHGVFERWFHPRAL